MGSINTNRAQDAMGESVDIRRIHTREMS
jgi:hypothetical protein